MMRLMGGTTVVAVGVMLAPVVAQAQTPVLVNARVEISAAVAGSSATLEAIERQANARDRARQEEIAALQTRLTEAEARGASEVARLQGELIEAREALVADLASRDRAYAEEIAVFRREVTAIASTPEGAAALARYNAGDRVGAIAVLDRLIQARDAARQTRAAIEGAAERRQVATLALDARGKSDPAFDTGAVIARYEEVVRLDPGEYEDWHQLAKLHMAAGRRADALFVLGRLNALAGNDLQRSSAMDLLAAVLNSEGDHKEALSLYRRSLEIRERLAAADPASADLARNLSTSLEHVGFALWGQGDLDGALVLFQRSLEIDERLSAADPSSVDREVSLSRSLNRVADVLYIQGDRDGASAMILRSLDIAERLFVADPASAVLARNFSVSLSSKGNLLRRQGDIESALLLYQRSLEVDERLSAADPADVDHELALSRSLDRVGEMLRQRGDFPEALSHLRRSLEIRERLSAADPVATDLQQWVSDSLTEIGRLLVSQLSRRPFEIDGRLAEADPASAVLAREVLVYFQKIADRRGELSYCLGPFNALKNLEAMGALGEADRPFIAQIEGILFGVALGAPTN